MPCFAVPKRARQESAFYLGPRRYFVFCSPMAYCPPERRRDSSREPARSRRIPNVFRLLPELRGIVRGIGKWRERLRIGIGRACRVGIFRLGLTPSLKMTEVGQRACHPERREGSMNCLPGTSPHFSLRKYFLYSRFFRSTFAQRWMILMSIRRTVEPPALK